MIFDSLALGVLMGLSTLVAYFIVLTVADMFRRSQDRSAPHCAQCSAARLVPLLDASHRFLGEFACLRCGQTKHTAAP